MKRNLLLICLFWIIGIAANADEIPNNEIWYTSANGDVLAPSNDSVFGASIVSNTYSNGKGVIKFNEDVTSIGDGAFISCSGLTSITIPNSVTSIVRYAFYCCSGLTSVTIPNSVTSIGFDAFWGCLGLTSVTIPNSVKSIEDDAFVGCLGLTSINIPSSVTSIGVNPFDNCPALEVITVSDDNTYFSDYDSNVIVNKNTHELISGCKNSIIPSSVTSIGVKAFCHCSSLTSVIIPKSVTSIGIFAFRYCSNLTSVTVEWTDIANIVTPTEGSFDNVDLSKATLHVPAGTKSLYETADVWKDFGLIFEDKDEYIANCLPELRWKGITVSTGYVTTMVPEQWYLLYQSREEGGYMYDTELGGRIFKSSTSAVVTGDDANHKAPYLVRFVEGTAKGSQMAYYVQFGNGNYVAPGSNNGYFTDGPISTDDKNKAELWNIGQIDENSPGHFWMTVDAADGQGKRIDNDGTNRTVCYWDNGPGTAIGGNYDWQLYPVSLYDLSALDVTKIDVKSTYNQYIGYKNTFDVGAGPGQYGAVEAQAFYDALDDAKAAIDNFSNAESTFTIDELLQLSTNITTTYSNVVSSQKPLIPQSGWYYVISSLQFTETTGEVVTHPQKAMYASAENNVGLWNTLDENNAEFLWRFDYDESSGAYKVYNGATKGRFNTVSRSTITLSDTANINNSELKPYFISRDSVTRQVNLAFRRIDQTDDYQFIHMDGHKQGGGKSGTLVGYGQSNAASSWHVQFVDDSTANKIIEKYVLLVEKYYSLKTLAKTQLSAVEKLKATRFVTSADQLSSAMSDSTEGLNLSYLIDDDYSTFWHSDWQHGTVEPGTHFVQISLPEPISEPLALLYVRRNMGFTKDQTTKFSLYGSLTGDEETKAEWTHLNDYDFTDLTQGKELISDMKSFEGSFQYFRIYSEQTTGEAGYWHAAELNLISNISIIATMGSTYTDLKNILSEQENITSADITNDIYNTLKTAYDAFAAKILELNSNPIVFADSNVKVLCVANWDTNGDGELSDAEAAVVTDLGTVFMNNTTITSFNELRYFTGLKNLANCAFKNSSLESVVIPVNIESIGYNAFNGCDKLKSCTFDDIKNSRLVTMQYGVFRNCTNLTELILPNTLKTLGDTSVPAYEGGPLCGVGVETLDVPKSVTVIGGYAFTESSLKDMYVHWKELSEIPAMDWTFEDPAKVLTLHVPVGTKALYQNHEWFKYCANIVEDSEITFADANVKALCVTNWDTDKDGELSASEAAAVTDLGEVFKNDTTITSFDELQYFTGLTSIGDGAFSSCSSLTSITIPNSVVSIGDLAFEYCHGLTSVTIGDSVTSIGDYTFQRCYFVQSEFVNNSLLNEVSNNYWGATICDVIQDDGLCIKDNVAVGYRGKPTSVTIPNSVTSIGESAFSYCKSMTSIIIPDSVTSIGSSAFYDCSSLTSITIPNSVKSIGDAAFRDCSGLTSITISNSVTSIGDYAFEGCSGLVYITIPNSLTSIGKWAFYNCSGLTSVTIPDSVTSIGDYAFEGCSSLTSITIPNSVTSIGAFTFTNCSNLTSIAIPNSVTSIGQCAFFGCSSLTSITIPGSVTSIAMDAFLCCRSLTSVTVRWTKSDSIITPGTDAFYGIDLSKATLYVPAGTKALYEAADVWKDFGTIEVNPYLHEQENIIYAANTTIRNYVTTMELPIYLNNSVSMCATEFYLTMPEGVKIKYEYDEDEEDYVWSIAKGGRMRDEHAISCKQGTNGDYHFICSDLLSNKNFYDSEEKKGLPFMTLTLELDESLYYGDYEVMIHDLILNHNGDNGIEEYKTDEMASLLSLPNKKSLSVASNNEQYGTVAMSAKTYDEAYNDVDYNDNVTLTATPAQYCKFVKWTNNGEDLSTENPLTIAVVSDMNITAVFDLDQVTVTFNVDGAKYSSGLQNCGAQLTLPDAPEKTGYTFKGWENVTEYTVVPASDVTYEAMFEINKYTVSFLDYNGNPIYQQSQDWNSDIVAPADPTREDWFFLGWSPAIDATVPLNDVTYTAQYTLRGDVTGDNVRNVTDLTTLVNIILNKTQVDTRTFTAADVHVDDVLNITDLTSIVNLILNVGNGTQKVKSINGTSKASLSMDDVNAMAGFNSVLNINLTNGGNEITAGQFDLVLPEGVHVTSVTGTGLLASSHMVGSRIHEDGTVSVLFFSMSNDVVKSDEGSILNIGLEIDGTVKDGSYDIVMKDAVLATADEQSTTKVHTIGVLNVGNATSITGVAGSDNTTDGHNLSGLPVSAGYKGVVIKNGKKNLR